MPSVSIITASFNSGSTLEHCISSVANQTSEREHIIVDGASRDDTAMIIERNRDRLSMVISEPDQGIYDAMNKGLALARGEVVGFLNADDFYPEPDVLEAVVAAFDDPAVDACYGDLRYVYSGDPSRTVRYWKSGRYARARFYHGWMPPHPAFFVRRRVLETHGGFNTALGSAADYELMLRLLVKHGIPATYIPRVIVHMRTGGISNASIGNRLRANRMDRLAWRVNGLRPYPWTLLAKPLRKLGQWVVRG